MNLNSVILVKVFLIFISLDIYTSSTLISYLMKKDLAISKIINDLRESYKYWKSDSFSMFDIQTTRTSELEKNTIETLKFTEFKLDSLNFNPEVLTGQLNSDLKNKSITLISNSTSWISALQMKLNFAYSYNINYANSTISETKGTGWIAFFTSYVNYTQSYEDLSYIFTHYLSLTFSFFDSQLNKDDKRVREILKQMIDVNEVKQPLAEQLRKIILVGLTDYLNKADSSIIFPLTRSDGKTFTISAIPAANPNVLSPNSIVYIHDGSIKEANELEYEDSTIAPFIDFKTGSSANPLETSDFQLFLNKKIFINLFKTQYEKKLKFLDNDYVANLKMKNLQELNIRFLSKFYPEIVHLRSLDENFNIEYYFNSITWVDDNAKVDITFFFVSTRNVEVILEFNTSFFFILEVITGNNAGGSYGINFILKNPESFNLLKFDLLTQIESRFDFKSFSKFAKKLLISVFQKENYSLFKDYESFNVLVKEFNTIEVHNEGVILGKVKPKTDLSAPSSPSLNLKFLI